MRDMTKTIASLVLLAFLSCQSTETNQPEVKHYGALKLMMHQGDISSKFDMTKLQGKPNVYALGAIEKLKGEILIYNSEVLLSREGENGKVQIDRDLDGGASLLVLSQVPAWDTIAVPDTVLSTKDLEIWIETTASQQGIDTEKPFPFLLKGDIDWLQWHVINWPEGDTEHSHAKHVNSGPHGEITQEEVNILGFYSKHHHAIFTHHSTNMHMHFHTADKKLAGHVDGMKVVKGMNLCLPVLK